MEKTELIADEVIMIADGGEMPEVAFNGSVYFLTKDKDGPQLSLTVDDMGLLKDAVVQRFVFITLRDLQPENRTKSIYRGLERSCANWVRLVGYSKREQLSLDRARLKIAEALGAFLNIELHDVCVQGIPSCVNCTRTELLHYAESLKIDLDSVAKGWQQLF